MPVLLTVASPDCAEVFFQGSTPRNVRLRQAGSLPQLRDVLESWATLPPQPSILDIVGHSTSGHHLLRLGDTVVDLLEVSVRRFFRGLAASQVLDRLQVGTVRLLGCQTAVTDAGRRTLRLLAHTLRRPVLGTTIPLLKSHSNADGFNPAFTGVLLDAVTVAP